MDRKPLRSTDVGDRNQKLILRLLFTEETLSQSEVVKKTGLKAPTVFRIFSKLSEENYIRPCDQELPERNTKKEERKGRRPSYYCVVPTVAYAVGVDFSTTGASVIIVNFKNEVIHNRTIDFLPGVPRDTILEHIAEMIESSINTCAISSGNILGIGIGSPGVVDTGTGVVVEYTRIQGLNNFSLKKHFESLFRVPVFVHNNASLIAASEYHYTLQKNHPALLAVLVRGGVGGTFMNHGRIFLSGSTTALEIGRTATSVTDARSASADSRALETLVSEGTLLELLKASEGIQNWQEVQEKIPEARVQEILAAPAGILATATRNLYHILHPDIILVIARYTLLAKVLSRSVETAVPEVTVMPVTYDPIKACFGATDLVFQHFFNDNDFNGGMLDDQTW